MPKNDRKSPHSCIFQVLRRGKSPLTPNYYHPESPFIDGRIPRRKPQGWSGDNGSKFLGCLSESPNSGWESQTIYFNADSPQGEDSDSTLQKGPTAEEIQAMLRKAIDDESEVRGWANLKPT